MNRLIKEKGEWYLKDNKFRMLFNPPSNYLVVFDGEYIWYQADRNNKTLFQIKNHPLSFLFSHLFNKETFFTSFKIFQFEKNSSGYNFYLHFLKNNIKDIKKMRLSINEKHIYQFRIFLEDDGYQDFLFSSHWFLKRMPRSLFEFSKKNFKIIPYSKNVK